MDKDFNNWSYKESQMTYKMWEPQVNTIQESIKKHLICKNSEMMLNEKQINS